MLPPDFPDEDRRLDAVRRYAVLDSMPEQALDDIAALAAAICGVPTALISIVDEKRQWFKARVGFSSTETPRDISFCGHALLQPDLFVVPDAAADPRFADNPLVTGPEGIRFYAGAPLITPTDEPLGTLCVIDKVPHTLSPAQAGALRVLARQVMTHLELNRRSRELSESEQRLRMVTETAQVGMVIVNRERRYAYANEAYARILELPGDSIAGQRVADVLAGQYEAQIRPNLDRAFAGERITYDLCRKSSDGERHYAVRYDPRMVDGEAASVVVVITDITARMVAERGARRLAAIVSYSDDAIIGKDLSGTITSWNRGAEKIFGYAESEMVGSSMLRLIPPERQAEEEYILGRIRSGESVEHFETVRQTKSGALIDVSVTASPIKDAAGRIAGVSKVAREITARKRAEARFRRLVDSNVQGVVFWNREGRITGANDAFLELVGYSRDDLEADSISWKSLIAGAATGPEPWSPSQLAATGICAPLEKEFLRKDGKRVPVLAGAAAFEDQPEEGVCFVLDLSERKKLEQQFLRAQRMESIGTLAGGIAHDLNNVLTPILMSLALLEMKFDDEESKELIGLISASAQRGADMVRQVLSFARGVEGRRMELQIRHLIRDIEKIANDTFLKHIRVRTIVPHDLWTVLGDPTQLHQVLLNLCVNARDAMPDGGSLTITAGDLLIDKQYAGLIAEASPGPYVFIQVEDSGTGMPPEVMEKIFDPFYTTKELGRGTGLGLSTTQAIVRSHGGFLRVYSEIGKGTTFKVYLPAQTEASAESMAESTIEMPRGSGQLVLVVDDEASVRLITQQTLEAFGYRVLAAADGAEALACYTTHGKDIAVVLTDLMMPVMDGPSTIRVLRKLNPSLPIIAASGLNANGHVSAAASLGIQHFLDKPYTAETLLKILRKVLTP